MPQHTSRASRQRGRRLDQAHDAQRADRSRNRDAADQLPPSHGAPSRSQGLPNTHSGRVAPDPPSSPPAAGGDGGP
jgi:hypothetical protein